MSVRLAYRFPAVSSLFRVLGEEGEDIDIQSKGVFGRHVLFPLFSCVFLDIHGEDSGIR